MVFLSSEWVGGFFKIHLGQSPASPRAQVQGITSSVFYPTDGLNAITIPEWIEKKRSSRSDPGSYSHLTQLDRKSAGGDFLQLGSGSSRKLL